MARTIHRLTDRQVQNAKLPEGKDRDLLPDGGNLLLQVQRAAGGGFARSWVFRYQLDGKRHDLGLGPLHDVSLKDAREKAHAYRVKLLSGVSPHVEIQQRQSERLAQRVEQVKSMTFRQCAEQYMASHESAWKNGDHAGQWRTTMRDYVYPVLGDLPVAKIDTGLVMQVLQPIWNEKTETASRVRNRIELVLDWAKVSGHREGENPARWKGHLAHSLPKPSKVHKIEHHPALPYAEVPGLVIELDKIEHPSAQALEFLILTAARSGEVLRMTWDEIDFANELWNIPGERMKNGKPHRVPLSKMALAILAKQPRTEARVFPIGENALARRLNELHPDVTVHGLRSSFRDWASERTSYPNEVAEMALAHSIGNGTEAAYRRGDLLEKRRHMMADWATWCSRPAPTGATVTVLRTA
jgi:integrase